MGAPLGEQHRLSTVVTPEPLAQPHGYPHLRLSRGGGAPGKVSGGERGCILVVRMFSCRTVDQPRRAPNSGPDRELDQLHHWKPCSSWGKAAVALEDKEGAESWWGRRGPGAACTLLEQGQASLPASNWPWKRKPEITWNIQERKSKHPFFLLIFQNICSFVLF